MKYINANVILPDELVEELQKYVQAGYIYVPAKEEQHKAWGELSGYREELEKRNGKIISEYRQEVRWKSWLTGTAFRFLPSERLFIRGNERKANNVMMKMRWRKWNRRNEIIIRMDER